jgi:hypothetical protein
MGWIALFTGGAIAQQKEGSGSTAQKAEAESTPKSDETKTAQPPAAEPRTPSDAPQAASAEAQRSSTPSTTAAAPQETPAAAPQEKSGETDAKTAEPEVTPPPTQVPPPPSVQTKGKACLPKCRTGYVCQNGACISACNPPCKPDQFCSAEGVCVDAYPRTYAIEEEDYALQGKPIDPHHTGLYVHFGFGLGYTSLFRNKSDKVEIYGGSTHYTIDLGWAFIENLIVHARLGFDDATNPVVEYGEREYVDIRRSYLFAWKTLVAATYYIMPINIFGTIAVGIEEVDIKMDDLRLYYELLTKGSDVGFSLEVDIGKEWWADEEWGVGLTGRFGYANLSPEDTGSISDRLHVITSGLMLSISYN